MGFFLLVYGGFGLALAWLIRGVLVLVPRRASSFTRAGRAIWWAIVPVCLVVGIAASLLPPAPEHPLFRARFALSERALTARAERLTSAPVQDQAPHRVGLFWILRIDSGDEQVRFITAKCAVVDSCGLVYSPRRNPQRWQEDKFVHIRGPWWHLFEGF
jgi:hypothetical protein